VPTPALTLTTLFFDGNQLPHPHPTPRAAETLSRSAPLLSELPALVARLEALRAVHEQSAVFARDLDALAKEQVIFFLQHMYMVFCYGVFHQELVRKNFSFLMTCFSCSCFPMPVLEVQVSAVKFRHRPFVDVPPLSPRTSCTQVTTLSLLEVQKSAVSTLEASFAATMQTVLDAVAGLDKRVAGAGSVLLC
jgi:hypothetical protein